MFPPQGAPVFSSNWFDQLGLKGGLQQFSLDGKKRYRALVLTIYRIDYIEICKLTQPMQMAVIVHQTA